MYIEKLYHQDPARAIIKLYGTFELLGVS